MEMEEIRDLTISALVLAFLFSYTGPDASALFRNFPAALVAVSLSFVAHELGHRTLAKKFDCYAQYKIWMHGVILAVLMTLVTNGALIFAALGAVHIYPRIDVWGRTKQLTKKRSALISLSGPATNILLAAIFFIAGIAGIYTDVAFLGAKINAWFALFNLLPLAPLDGAGVFAWSRKLWALAFILCIALFVFL